MSHVVATIYCNVYRMEFSVKNCCCFAQYLLLCCKRQRVAAKESFQVFVMAERGR